MQFNIDKRFIEILNEQGGHNVTWEQFRAAYDLRRSERDVSAAGVAKTRKQQLLNERELAFYESLIASQSPTGAV